MGFGLGAAIGAQIGNPDKVVLHVTGDGSFRMNCNELCTEEYYNLPIITLLYNNGALGMVRQWQSLMYDKRYSQTTLDRGPDFVKLAEAYGVSGIRVHTKEELKLALEAALKDVKENRKGCVIDCAIHANELVRPMVPGGKSITSFIVD